MGKVYDQKKKYDPRGVFMFFENYNVEARDRVKYITATDGVPLSIQWNTKGYYYPTQIAQFGLMHFSKNINNNLSTSKEKILENAETINANWQKSSKSKIERIFDDKLQNHVLKFSSSVPIDLNLTQVSQKFHYFVFNFDVFLKSDKSRLMINFEDIETKRKYTVNYVNSNDIFSVDDSNIYYGLGNEQKWKSFSRDVLIDLQKGSQFFIPSVKISKPKIILKSLSLSGNGLLDNLTISQTVNHRLNFLNSANWFLKNQNKETGGWPNAVKKRFSNILKELKPGWYSAMAQGHALSLLTRTYLYTGNSTKYLTAALNGLKLFSIAAKDGGIVNLFLEKYVWYEEYPTTPPSFVLNGFIYSLFGLYDLKEVSGSELAAKLYRQGMTSLKQLLPLFDLGSRSAYDLRHFSKKKVAPNVARWEYHLTHINQLLILSTIDDDPIFKIFAIRWIQYMKGKVANHN